MQKTLLTTTTIIAILLFTGCSTKDYSSDMKKVLNPMQKKLGSFYKKEKRFPTIAERNKLLEESNCKVVDNKCEYNGNKFLIISETTNIGAYDLELTHGYSSCYTGLFSDGDSKSISCTQESKYDIGQ